MSILNRKNQITFSFVGFAVAFTLVVSGAPVNAHDLTESGPTCPSGLVSWWTGDEISGKTVLDIKGKNNGTMVGGVSIVPGKVGNAFKFDGKSGYITMGNPESLNFGTKPFSLEFWIYWDGGPNVNSVLRKASHPIGGRGAGYWIRIGGTHMELFMGETIGPDGNPKGHFSTLFTPNTWHHVVAARTTLNSQSQFSANTSLIIDGSERGGVRIIPDPPVTVSDAPFIIGARNDETGTSEFFSGMIDEISVYNRALDWLNEARPIIKADSAGKCHKLTPTPEPSKPPVSPTPTKSPIPKVLSAISYPVADLGNCTSYDDCKTYCGTRSNFSQCAAFAQKNNLTAEIPDDKKAVFAAMQKGESPGQCKDEASCRNYCEDIDHIGECVDFVEKFNLASSDELKEIRQMADIKKSGVSFPGNCKTKESCLKYCDNSANAVVCMEFAQKAGFIPKEDAEAVGKILPYLKSGGKLPGGCTTKESCDAYCDSDTHTNECVDFAVGAGFMSKEEADIVKKVGGKGPGNCRSREACENYCKDAAHIDECVDFAVKAGFISKEDAEMAKKFKITSGPGGCKGKADCEAFCVVNQDVCFQFAKDHGMLSEEDLKNIEEQKKFLGSLDQAPPEWLACMEKELGSAFFGRFKAGKLTGEEAKSQTLESAQRKCEPDIRKETEACLALSCSEFEACLKSLEQVGGEQGGEQQQQAQGTPDPKIKAKAEACQKEKVNACLAKSCGEFQACLSSLGGGGGGGEGGTPDLAVQAKFQSCQPKKGEGDGGGSQPPSSGDGGGQQQQQGGDQSQIPQGYSSWEAFCRAQPGDSRCAAYAPQIPQQYPLLIDHSFLGAMLRYLLK